MFYKCSSSSHVIAAFGVWLCCPGDHNWRKEGAVPVYQSGFCSGSNIRGVCVSWSLRWGTVWRKVSQQLFMFSVNSNLNLYVLKGTVTSDNLPPVMSHLRQCYMEYFLKRISNVRRQYKHWKKHDTNTELLSSVYGEVYYLTVNYIAKTEWNKSNPVLTLCTTA